MKKQVVCATLISMGFISFAQEVETTKFGLSSVSLQLGFQSYETDGGNSLSDFRKLSKKSILLEEDFSDYNSSQYYVGNLNSIFGTSLHFSKPDKEGSKRKLNSELRIGIGVMEMDILSAHFNKEEKKRVDTLVSTSRGQTYFVDSVSSNSYSMFYSQSQLFLNVDYTVGSYKANRFRYYIGAGIGLGYAFNSRTTVNLATNSYYESDVNLSNSYNNTSSFNHKTERFENENALVGRLYIPIGLDVKLSKTNETWKKCHIYFETSPSLNYINIPELSPETYFSMNNIIGFKYDFY